MALCPSLIVLLLSSLVYFVILCVYQGGYSSRLGYIWFMFILGTVNLARLSIEQSRTYAFGYAAVLGIATFFVLSRFQTFAGGAAAIAPIFNLIVLAAVWFLADRITYDCTLIDDDDDASGQGLLDGLSSREAETGNAEQSVLPAEAGDGSEQPPAKPRRKKKKHQPGRTVLWLTAAALPIFGAGQVFLRNDPALQSSALFALAIYLFATLSLLVATSFLGVRRYLRQRGVEMPGNVSTAWLGGGIVTIAIILMLCFALPKPGQMLANLELPTSIESPDWLKPSKYGWGSETAKPTGAGESDATAAAKPEGQPGDESEGEDESGQSEAGQSEASKGEGKPGEAGEGKGDQQGEGEGGQQGGNKPGEKSGGEKSGGEKSGGEKSGGDQSGGEKSGGEKSGGEKSDSKSENQQSGQEKSDTSKSDAAEKSESSQQDDSSQQNDSSKQNDQPKPDEASQQQDQPAEPPAESSSSQSSQWLPSLSGILKAIIYLILLAIVAAFVWINRAAIADFWQRIKDWLEGKNVTTSSSATMEDLITEPASPPRPFASFTNPLAQGVEPRRAVIETFQATEAWYREHGHPRRGDETPQEYTNRLTKTATGDRAALTRLTDAYNRIVYGGGTADQDDLQSVKAMWQSFRNAKV